MSRRRSLFYPAECFMDYRPSNYNYKFEPKLKDLSSRLNRPISWRELSKGQATLPRSDVQFAVSLLHNDEKIKKKRFRQKAKFVRTYI